MDQAQVLAGLDRRGYAHLGAVLQPTEIDELLALYTDKAAFRKRIVMGQHGYGEGEYQYFAYPLPAPVEALRQRLYPALAPIANEWQAQLGSDLRYPATLDEMLARCHAAGQTRPTPLMLKYAAGDYNRLHQDLYGEHRFPLQVVVLLSDPRDFSGGEFVLTEQRPRMQSRVEVVPLQQGHGVVFAVHERPQPGKRGYYRVQMRHGVSELREGSRSTLGIIFHDAT